MYKYGFIYMTINNINQKFYIGKRVIQNNNTDKIYLGSGTAIIKSIAKYGKSNFSREILCYCNDAEELENQEINLIKQFDAINRSIGYNIITEKTPVNVIVNHPDRKNILLRRVESWKKNYYNSPEFQRKRKLQLDEARLKRKKRPSHRKTPIVEIDIKTNNIVKRFDSIMQVEDHYNVSGISSSIKRKGMCGKRYFQFEDNIQPYVVKEVWNKGVMGVAPNSKKIICLDLKYKKVREYKSLGEVTSKKTIYGIKGIRKACKRFLGEYRGLRWAYKEDYQSSLITTVEEVSDCEYVYNIEVKDNHNYYVNGILLHNCDDPQSPKKAASEMERANTKNFYDHTLYSRLNDPDIGVRIIVMQRLHEEDLTGHLMEQRPEDHDHICIPAELDENINPPELKEFYNEQGLFWPTRFNNRSINSFKKTLGLLQTAGQLQQRPAPAEGNIVKRDWFEILSPEMVSRNPATEPIHFILDTAYSEKQTDDPSGILAVFQRDNYIYVINFTEIWKPFPELVAYIDPYVKLNGYTASSLIYVEPKASGRSLVQQLRAAKLNIVEIEGDILKDDKMQRLSACSATMQAGKMKLIRGAWNDKFLTQLTTFPNAKHDEAVDTACYAIDLLVGSNRLPFGFL